MLEFQWALWEVDFSATLSLRQGEVLRVHQAQKVQKNSFGNVFWHFKERFSFRHEVTYCCQTKWNVTLRFFPPVHVFDISQPKICLKFLTHLKVLFFILIPSLIELDSIYKFLFLLMVPSDTKLIQIASLSIHPSVFQ